METGFVEESAEEAEWNGSLAMAGSRSGSGWKGSPLGVGLAAAPGFFLEMP